MMMERGLNLDAIVASEEDAPSTSTIPHLILRKGQNNEISSTVFYELFFDYVVTEK